MSTTKADDHISVDFIDPLFAVALGLNFEEIGREPWFGHIWVALGTPDTRFIIATVLLGYATVILSWVGYHRSVKRNPIKLSKLSGWGRFILDVILLILYFLLLVRYHNFGGELYVLGFIYFVFIVWDIFKMREHPRGSYGPEETQWLRCVAQRGVTVFWFIVFVAFALFYRFSPPRERFGCEDWLMWLSALAATVLYRVHKDKRWFTPLLLFLGYRCAE